MISKRTKILYIIFLFMVFSCKPNPYEECKIDVIKKSITLPEEYSLINCNPEEEGLIISVVLNLSQYDLNRFLNENKGFKEFKKKQNGGIQTPHFIFFNRLGEYFKGVGEVDIKKTYFYHVKDEESNYLTFLLNHDGNLFVVLEDNVAR